MENIKSIICYEMFQLIKNKMLFLETNQIYTGGTGFKELIKNCKAKKNELTKSYLISVIQKEVQGFKIKEKKGTEYLLTIEKNIFIKSLKEEINKDKDYLCSIYNFNDEDYVEHSVQTKPKELIMILRERLAEIMNHVTEDSVIYMINDGTGTGKSYNVINNFVEQVPKHSCNMSENIRIHNMIYCVPQKIQMKIANEIHSKAKKKNIITSQIKSRMDLIDLNTTCWTLYDEKENKLLINKDFFNYLFSFKDNKKLQDKINELYKNRDKNIEQNNTEDYDIDDGVFSKVNKPNITKLFNLYGSYQATFYDSSAEEQEKKDAAEFFRRELDTLGKFLCIYMPDNEIKNMVNSVDVSSLDSLKKMSSIYDFIFYVLYHHSPLEIAKHRTSLIFLTGDKYLHNVGYSDYSLTGKNEKVYRFTSITDAISGVVEYKEGEISKYVIKSEEEQKIFLKNNFLKMGQNIFAKKNVTFSLVIDEEHIFSTNELTKYNSIDILGDRRSLVEQQYNVIDSLAAIYRLMNNFASGDIGITELEKEGKKQFILNLVENLYSHSEFFKNKESLRNKQNLLKDPVYKLFENFNNNTVHLNIDANYSDNLRLICNNIYAFSPKTLVNIENLKNIKLKLISNGIFIDSPESYKDDDFSLFDLFQLILVVLFSCKDMAPALKNSLSQYNDGQNKPLERLSNVCKKYKNYLESMFDSSFYLDEKTDINTLLVYFLPKIMFSIALTDRKDIKYKDNVLLGEEKTKYVSGEIKITLSKEMFEVSLLKILQKKGNKVFLLSATRGYENIFTGQYSIDFFNKYKNVSVPYRIVVRDDEVMKQFTEERKKKRSIFVNHYPNLNIENKYDSYNVSSVSTINKNNVKKIKKELSTEEKKKFNCIYNKLKNNVKTLYHQYKSIELENIVFFTALHIAKNENAMILSLSNDYMNNLNKDVFLKCGNGILFNEYIMPNMDLENKIDNKDKIFEFALPKDIFGEKKKTRIILFNSKLGQEARINEFFNADEDTNIILISSYNSAGTGINLCINDNRDFDSISFANDPYYSSVKGDTGFQSSSNTLLLMKHIAFGDHKKLSEVNDIINSDKGFSILIREHLLEILKTIEQAVGRIERRDVDDFTTNINFIDNKSLNLFKTILSQYYYCNATHRDTPVINNKSMLNRSLYNVAEFVIEKNILENQDRKELEDKTRDNNKIVKNFLENDFKDMLRKFRNGDKEYEFVLTFNEQLRSIINLNDWKKQKNTILDKLKKMNINEVMFNKIRIFLNAAVVDVEDILDLSVEQNEELLISYSKDRNYFTDISKSNHIFDIEKEISFSPNKIIKDLDDAQKEINIRKSKKYLPVPYFLTLLKGNIGEFIMLRLLRNKNILNDELFKIEKYKKIYELFDLFIDNGEKIICIDVKNWLFINNAKGDKAIELLSSKIDKVGKLFNKPVEFYYINVDPENNAKGVAGLDSLFTQKGARFFNLFVSTSYYVEKYNENKDKKKNYISLENSRLKINPDFYNILNKE